MCVRVHTHTHTHTHVCACEYAHLHICGWISRMSITMLSGLDEITLDDKLMEQLKEIVQYEKPR